MPVHVGSNSGEDGQAFGKVGCILHLDEHVVKWSLGCVLAGRWERFRAVHPVPDSAQR